MKTRGAWGGAVLLLVVAGCGDDESSGTGGGSTADASSSSATATTSSGSTTTTTSTTSGGDGGGGAAGTGGNGGAGGGGGSDVEVFECGEDTDVIYDVTFTNFVTMTPVEGAVSTSDLCEDLEAVTSEEGRMLVALPSGVAFNPRTAAEGYLTLRGSEQALEADLVAAAGLLPEAASALLPGWSEDSPTILVLTRTPVGGEPGDPCSTADGIVISVVDHPEAEITYYAGEGQDVAPDPDLTETDVNGAAVISGLEETGGEATIELAATKEGCDTLSFASYPASGRYVLENGVLTGANLVTVPAEGP